jgi:8-oxo-dGTP diphosphatase
MDVNTLNGFNVRVYAICIENNKLLTIKEPFNGQIVTKLPGGGLEFGEGTINCLKRELLEELNIEITNITPFYIQEHYIESAIKNNKQLLMLYFKVTIKDLNQLKIMDTSILDIYWKEINDECPLSLEADKNMYTYLKSNLKKC